MGRLIAIGVAIFVAVVFVGVISVKMFGGPSEEEAIALVENKRIVQLETQLADMLVKLTASQAETLAAKKEVFDLKIEISDFKVKIAGLEAKVTLKDDLLAKTDAREAKLAEREKDLSTKEKTLAATEGGFAERERILNDQSRKQDAREKKYREVVIGERAKFEENTNRALTLLMSLSEKCTSEGDKLNRLRRSGSSFAIGTIIGQERALKQAQSEFEARMVELITMYKERREILDTFH